MWSDDDIGEGADLVPVKAKFIELWAKYPDRTPNEVAESAFTLCGLEPGFRFAQCANVWKTDLEVLEARDRAKVNNVSADQASKEDVLREVLNLARNERVDERERVKAYNLWLEANGYIIKQTSKETGPKLRTPPAIIFKPVDFDRDPEGDAA